MYDLSGITGIINYDATSVTAITMLGTGLILALFFLFIHSVVSSSKSKEYRELMVDMFIVGMIKKYAKEKEIDLVAELKEYATILKKAKLRLKGLDEVIESELKEKISKVNEEKAKF